MTGIRERLKAWVAEELVAELGLQPRAAAEVSERVLTAAETDLPAASDVDRLGWYAASAVTCARATSRCPGGQEWWRRQGAPVLRLLAGGRPADAQSLQAELLAGPFDAELDVNWPDEKKFWAIEIPGALGIGSTFTAGDEEGGRYECEIIARNGQTGVRLTGRTSEHPTDDISLQASEEAERLATTPRGPSR